MASLDLQCVQYYLHRPINPIHSYVAPCLKIQYKMKKKNSWGIVLAYSVNAYTRCK